MNENQEIHIPISTLVILALLVLLAIVMVWRLTDLFKPKGRWTEEVNHELSEEVAK